MFVRYIQIQTAVGDKDQASRIADTLLQKRLAACVQITGPVKSVYRWKDVVEQAEEWILIAKTRTSLFRKVEQMILDNHPYELPEITVQPVVGGGKDYLRWIRENTR